MTVNYCAIGRRLALSRTTASTWVRAYARAGLLHLVPSLGDTRKPILFLSPRFADDARSFSESEVLEAMRLIIPECRFYFWRTGRVRRIPLVADTGTERIGFCFSSTLTPQRWQWLPLLIALRRGVIDRAFLLHENTYATLQEHAVPVLPQWAFLREPRAWIVDRRTPADARRAMREINRERLARPFPPR